MIALRRTLVGLASSGLLATAFVAAGPAEADIAQPDCNVISNPASPTFYEKNPVYTDNRDDSADWVTGTPASVNLDDAKLTAGINALKSQYPTLRSVIIMRHGKLVKETYVNGGARNQARNIHSGSKSILQMLFGIAVSKGQIPSLDAKISNYLPSSYFTWASPDITIRQMLNMSSGLKWTEDKTENQVDNTTDWVKAILDQGQWYTPGTRFKYSTGNTHVLSKVLQTATGVNTCQYASQNLFTKLNVTAERWGKDPNGVFSGGYNVYMRPREYARFAQLSLQNGVWNGQQLVPTVTVQEARTQKWDAGEGFFYNSGYWSRTINGVYMYIQWGYGGQFNYVIPSLDLVFSTTQDTASYDGEINSGDFIANQLLPAVLGP